jgi:Domain of unknown function (DUF4055)
MSVTIPHQAYQAMLPVWMTYRDAYLGEEAVKGATVLTSPQRGTRAPGTRYLPRPAGMRREEQYAMYRDRPAWMGATERTVQGITGAIFRHEPVIVAPTALEPQLLDITQTGVALQTYAEEVVSEDLLMGRFGLLVDYPQGDRPGASPPGVASEARPYWVSYKTEEIRNWRTIRRQGKTILSLVVLQETLPIVQGDWGSDDFFVTKDQVQYRVLRLNEAGQYEVSLWVEDPGSGPAVRRGQLVDAWIPQRQGRPLDFIPFKFVGPFNSEVTIQKSLLAPLIYQNFLCWRHSADKEHALHKTAMPTTVIGANVEQPPELYLGGDTALFFPDNQLKAFLLEFHGHGLQPHENALKEDLQLMAMFGASILQGAPQVQETATSVQWRMSGHDSPVQRLIRTCSEALTWCLQVHAWWQGVTENVDDPGIHMTLNKDLVSNRMEPQMLVALQQALLNGTISYATYYKNLQDGEIARPLVPVEEEQALLETEQAQRPLAPVRQNGTRPALNGSRREE